MALNFRYICRSSAFADTMLVHLGCNIHSPGTVVFLSSAHSVSCFEVWVYLQLAEYCGDQIHKGFTGVTRARYQV